MEYFRYVPYLLLTPFYVAFGFFIYYLILSLSPALAVKVIDYNPKTIVAGENVTVNYYVTHFRDCTNHVTRTLTNKQTYAVKVISYFERDVYRGSETYDSVVKIPIDTVNGEYELTGESKPTCNIYDFLFPTTLQLPVMTVTVNNDPVVLKDLIIKNPKIVQGEALNIENVFEKRRFCAAVVDTFVMNKDINTLVARVSRPTASFSLGPNVIKENLPINVPPGQYIINRTVTYTCPERTYSYKYNSPTFEVVAKDA